MQSVIDFKIILVFGFIDQINNSGKSYQLKYSLIVIKETKIDHR